MGKGLMQVSQPDVMINHTPEQCIGCGANLTQVRGTVVERRQVFDIPPPEMKVTEYRVEEKRCAWCGELTRGSFPKQIRGPVQYGERIQGLIAYFSHAHFIPIDRVCEIFKDIFGVTLASGTCAHIEERLFSHLEVFEGNLKTALLAAHVLHFDETGMRCEKKLHWGHVAASSLATLYTMHTKRGKEAMDQAGILTPVSRQSVLSALHHHLIAPMCFEGTCDIDLFNLWLRQELLPHIPQGSVLIFDNASFHKSEETKQIIKSFRCEMLFLPLYSPDLNPIEKYWANMKRKIREILPTVASLSEALDQAILSM